MPTVNRRLHDDCSAPGECADPRGLFSWGDLFESRAHSSARMSVSPDGGQFSSAKSSGQRSRTTRLARTIESEIIPRLMIAHSEETPRTSPIAPPSQIKMPDVERFAELVVTQDAAVGYSCVAAVLDQGVSVETIYMDLLAPAARRLGDLFDEDICYFTDVSIGLARLHQIMMNLAEFMRSRSFPLAGARRALLVSLCEEKHNFGLFMAANFFRRAGWDVFGWPLMAPQELAAIVCNESFHLVGISVSCTDHLDRVRRAISMARKASRNRAVKIMVGGLPFCDHPETAAELGADAASSDGLQAVQIANKLVGSVPGAGRTGIF
ncbi:cobalamin-binding protein [Methylocella silvestris]|uniref:Cobalamin-binding protein n=2 Tax=Methylocella silvestris TaxID=199596 RepID=A0A2J7TDD9_METSI|nr:cobalamin-binding protein [Methylocella silvestris]